MRTSNPALKDALYGTRAAAGEEAMTINGTIGKAFVLMLLALGTATFTWHAALNGRPGLASAGMLVGVIGGFVVSLVGILKPRTAPFTAPAYALLEGLALGAISAFYQTRYAGVPIQAVTLTFLTLFSVLALYRAGVLRATERFRAVVMAATFGVMLFYMLSIVLGLFGIQVPLIQDASPVGIVFSGAVLILAAMHYVLDFDFIERGAAAGAPKYLEFYSAMALLITTVWVYLEALRLFSKLQRRR